MMYDYTFEVLLDDGETAEITVRSGANEYVARRAAVQEAQERMLKPTGHAETLSTVKV